MSNAMVTETKLFLEKRTPELTRFSRGGVQASALTMLALQELTNNASVRDATPQSVYCALLACAITGLEPGSLKQEAFLIPFKRCIHDNHGERWITEVKFLVGWRGIVKQAMRAGGVRWIRSAIVHEGDLFEIDNAASAPIVHKPRIGTAPGAVLGAYALAKLTNGEFQHEWMDIDKLEKIRKFANSKSKTPSPAWQQWPEEMYRKSVVRALGKYLPMDETYFSAERLEQAHYDADAPDDSQVLDLLTDGAATAHLQNGGPVAGFTAALPPAPAAKPADKARAGSKDKPIEAKATEVKDPPPPAYKDPMPTNAPLKSAAPASPPSAPSSSSSSPPSPTTGSTSVPSLAPTASSSSASFDPMSPPDEDAGQGNEPREAPLDDDDCDDPFEDPPATEPLKIHGFPASLAGFDAWLKATKTRDALKDQIDGWRTWARDVAKFDPGYKPTGPSDPTPARAPAPEIASMHERFNAHWRVTK